MTQMEIFPPVNVARFDKLAPGDLFICPHESGSFFALKTEEPTKSDSDCAVVLGPHFPYGPKESALMNLQHKTVISFGDNYSILLPTEPDLWLFSGNMRKPVCVAVCEQNVYVCTNGSASPEHFFQCFVEFSTGKLVEGRLSGPVAYTNNWEIVIPHQRLLQRTLLKYRGKGDGA